MAKVATVYAKALFELGTEKSQLDSIRAELSSFAETLKANPDLNTILAGGGFNPNDRRAILEQVMAAASATGVVKKLLELLAARGRIVALPEILAELDSMIEASQGVRAGLVRAAVELSQEELSVLSSALAKRIGAKVRLTQVVDPSLLGGVVATVSGRTFDASLRSQLERFKNELI